MDTWCPLFSKVVDSSLWCEPDFVVKVFLTLLAKKDADHVVRGSAFMIAQWSKKTEQEVLDALKVLGSPDTRRVEQQPFDGRRIERHPEGWLVLNGEVYKKMMQSVSRRAYNAKWMSDKRKKLRNQPQARETFEVREGLV